MADLNVKVGADITELINEMRKANSSVEGFKDGIGKMAGALGLAFGIKEIGSFGLELSKLAGQADGVKQAFSKLQGSEGVLASMQEATRGTVSQLELMKNAVQAQNFNIPIQQLGGLFEFAYERAKATGQSVDYLVQSIVTGIGRKSPLILDNLGISAVALREKLHGVGTESATVGDVAKAVGEIAKEAMDKAGHSAETASERLAQNAAKWDELKEKIGQIINQSTTYNGVLTNLHDQLTVWSDDNISFWRKLFSGAEEYHKMAQVIKEDELQKARDARGMAALAETFGVNSAKVVPIVKNIAYYEAEISRLKNEEKTLLGTALDQNQKLTQEYQKQLGILQNQYNIHQDQKDTALLNKANAGGQDSSLPALRGYDPDTFGKMTGTYSTKVKAATVDTMTWLKALAQTDKQGKDLTSTYASFAQVAGAALGSAISGHKNFAQVLTSIIPTIISALGALAIAQITADATSQQSTGGNYYLAVALVAAGVALIGGIFAGLGSQTGGGAAASAGGVPATSYGRVSQQSNIQDLKITGSISGRDIVLASHNQAYYDSRTVKIG